MKRFTVVTAMWLMVCSLAAEQTDASKLAAEILARINQERLHRELLPLQTEAVLQELADQWAERSARLNRMEHRKNLPALQQAHGFSYLNENIYRFSAITTADRVVAAWMKSRGHQRNLLSPRAELGAVAVGFTAKGGTIVVFQGGRK
ncbi:MAG: CAP domain-containing protein [Verrucomicrobiota bacterium]